MMHYEIVHDVADVQDSFVCIAKKMWADRDTDGWEWWVGDAGREAIIDGRKKGVFITAHARDEQNKTILVAKRAARQ